MKHPNMQFLKLFELFNDWLQSELDPTPVKNVRIGDVCAVRYKNKWCRGLVEDVKGGVSQVFLVDFGHRQDGRSLWGMRTYLPHDTSTPGYPT